MKVKCSFAFNHRRLFFISCQDPENPPSDMTCSWHSAGKVHGHDLLVCLFVKLIQSCQHANWLRFRRTVIHLGARSREAWLRQADRTVMWLNDILFQGEYSSWVSSSKWVKVKDAADAPGWVILLHVTFILQGPKWIHAQNLLLLIYFCKRKPTMLVLFSSCPNSNRWLTGYTIGMWTWLYQSHEKRLRREPSCIRKLRGDSEFVYNCALWRQLRLCECTSLKRCIQ